MVAHSILPPLCAAPILEFHIFLWKPEVKAFYYMFISHLDPRFDEFDLFFRGLRTREE